MTDIVNIFHRYELLDQFVRWYEEQGATRFLVSVLTEDGSSPIKAIRRRFKRPSICEQVMVETPHTGQRDAAATDLMRVRHVKPDDWYVPADLDEFHEPFKGTIAQAIKRATTDALTSHFVDRIAADWTFPAKLAKDVFKQFPRSFPITKEVFGGWTGKVMAAKGKVPVTSGHHLVPEGFSSEEAGVTNHFKWWGDVATIARDQLRRRRAAGLPEYRENVRLLGWMEEKGLL